MIAKKQLTVTKASGKRAFDVELTGFGGKIIAMLPQKISSVAINAAGNVKRGQSLPIDIALRDSNNGLLNGSCPLRVNIYSPTGELNEYSDYYAAINGVLNIDFAAALNDETGSWRIEVEDLMSGRKSQKKFSVKK